MEADGCFEDTGKTAQINAGWFDWFCKDSSLANKTKALAKKLRSIVKSPRFNPDSTYVMFKNNCPVNGTLYDDFRILDADRKVLFTVVPRNGHQYEKDRMRKGGRSGLAEVWGTENGFEDALIEGTWAEIRRWFLQK